MAFMAGSTNVIRPYDEPGPASNYDNYVWESCSKEAFTLRPMPNVIASKYSLELGNSTFENVVFVYIASDKVHTCTSAYKQHDGKYNSCDLSYNNLMTNLKIFCCKLSHWFTQWTLTTCKSIRNRRKCCHFIHRSFGRYCTFQLRNLITVIETRKLPSSNGVLTSDRTKERTNDNSQGDRRHDTPVAH